MSLLGAVTQSRPIPGVRDLIALVEGAMSNARQKYGDAVVLLESGRWSGACSSGTMALEEIGKAILCAVAIIMPPTFRQEFRLWRLWRSHGMKLAAAHLVSVIFTEEQSTVPTLDALMDTITSAANVDNTAKFNSFYVDYDDGRVILPSAVGEATASAIVATVHKVLDEFDGPLSADNLHSLVTAEGADHEVLVKIMRRLMSYAADESGFLESIYADIDALRAGTFDWFSPESVALPPGLDEWQLPRLESSPQESPEYILGWGRQAHCRRVHALPNSRLVKRGRSLGRTSPP
jgi:AbiV family abortive infection protein